MASDEKRNEALVKIMEGERLLRDGDHVAALAAPTEAISLRPDLASAYLDRSQTYRYLDRHKEAHDDYRFYYSRKTPPSLWKSWVGRIKCRLGAHRGHWEYKSPTECYQDKICHRCSARLERSEFSLDHIPSGEWIFSHDGKCDQLEKCPRCNRRFGPKKENHDNWGTRTTCTRCGDIDLGPG